MITLALSIFVLSVSALVAACLVIACGYRPVELLRRAARIPRAVVRRKS